MQARSDHQIGRREMALLRCFEILLNAYERIADREKAPLLSDALVGEGEIDTGKTDLHKQLPLEIVWQGTVSKDRQSKRQGEERYRRTRSIRRKVGHSAPPAITAQNSDAGGS